MSSDEVDQSPPAPRWQRLPGPVRIKLAHMIADHLRTQGSVNYGELRDLRDFSPWFGTHLGHRGEKRFDRMVKSVRQNQPRKTMRRSTAERDPVEQPFNPSQECPMPSVAKRLARAGAPNFEDLLETLWRRNSELENSIAGCVNEMGEIVAPQLHKQYSTEQRATMALMGQLSKQYHDAMTAGPAVQAVMERLLAGQDPEVARQIVGETNALLQQATGLHALRSPS